MPQGEAPRVGLSVVLRQGGGGITANYSPERNDSVSLTHNQQLKYVQLTVRNRTLFVGKSFANLCPQSLSAIGIHVETSLPVIHFYYCYIIPTLNQMLKNYFKIAWRNLKRNKAYTAINVIGLSLGIACSILIFTLITFHLSFDNFHPQKDRIYRLITHWQGEDGGYSHGVPGPLGKAFQNNYNYAEQTVRVISYNDALIALPGEKNNPKFEEEQGVSYTEDGYFQIFNFPFLSGSKTTALKAPNSAVITEHLAKKYFNTADAIGNIIRFNNETDFTITGVIKDKPANTDQKQEIYVSFENLKDHDPRIINDDAWGGVYSESRAYTLLKPNTNAAVVNKALVGLVQQKYDEDDRKTWRFLLQPLPEMHFNPDYEKGQMKPFMWALGCIGLFLIITACVNFINLATAQALSRSKEVGIRKVLGSLKGQLFWQFIAETFLITVLALLLGAGLAKLALPYFNKLFDADNMHIDYFNNLGLAAFLLSLVLVVTFLAGSYPGLVMARFQPVLALKSKLSQKHIGGFSLRRILVVTQFAISQMLIIGTIVIASQMNFTSKADLGFTKEAIVMLPVPTNDSLAMHTLATQLSHVNGIEKLSLCYQAPAANSNNNTSIHYENREKVELFSVNQKIADDQFLSLFNIKLVAGRNNFPSDTVREFVVNEALVKKLGLKKADDIIGKMISINGSEKFPVVGVVKDFNSYSMHEEIPPLVIMPSYGRTRNCAIKINAKNVKPTLAEVEKIWNTVYPNYLYKHQFLDERIARFYREDGNMLSLIEIFACIAIFIGCLGLYGLVSFMAARKTKEIGVRKVLGASLQSLIWLFGKEFTRLLIIAFLIAAPLAWWAMYSYLKDFSYRITIGPGIFATAIAFTFFIALITVGYRSVKAALSNPVKSLRTE